MRCAKVDVVAPGLAAILAYLYMRMTFGKLACRDRLVVDVGIVSCAIGIEGDGRIGALRLRNASSYLELSPGGAGVCTDGSALLAPALINR